MKNVWLFVNNNVERKKKNVLDVCMCLGYVTFFLQALFMNVQLDAKSKMTWKFSDNLTNLWRRFLPSCSFSYFYFFLFHFISYTFIYFFYSHYCWQTFLRSTLLFPHLSKARSFSSASFMSLFFFFKSRHVSALGTHNSTVVMLYTYNTYNHLGRRLYINILYRQH